MTWNKLEIQTARKVSLGVLLEKRGYPLKPSASGYLKVVNFADLFVKDNYWFWKGQQDPDKKSGNTIDFFMFVEGLSFEQAMCVIAGKEKK